MFTASLLITTTSLLLGIHHCHHCPSRARFDENSLYDQNALVDENALDEASEIQESVVRHIAPTIVLNLNPRSVDNPTGDMSSQDVPSFWTAIPYGALSIRVKFEIAPDEPATADYIQLLLDGEPLNNNSFDLVMPAPPELSEDGRRWISYGYELNCPPLGKHVLQARYLKNNVWSQLSFPLRFDVRLPATPEIISVSDAQHASAPIRHSLVRLKGESLRVKLGRVKSGDRAILYVDGEEVCDQEIESDCCVCFEKIGKYLFPGIHTLTVRVAPAGTACGLTSKPSNEVLFHYFNESAYIFGCDKNCPSEHKSTQGADPCDGELNDDEDGVRELPPANKGAALPEPIDEKTDAQGEFVFASSAYFPIRDFGPRGEVIDREGAVIYEDMVFAFNTENGDYKVNFDISYPAVPTTINLRFLVRPQDTGPWYTITLKPIHLKPELEKDGKCQGTCPGTCQGNCQGTSHKCEITGKSHVLRICGKNICNGEIRREGSARFGFGLAGLSQRWSESSAQSQIFSK